MKSREKEKLQQTFGSVLRNIRLEGNISQAELTERGDFNRTYISDLERGLKEPSLSTILRLAYGLDISPGKLLQHFDNRFEIK